MVAQVNASWIGVLLKALPGPVLRVLDGWSYRLAQRKAAARKARLARKTAAA